MRDKLLLASLLACLLTPFAGRSLNVGGPIAVNTTYTLANSPYIVTSTLTVNPGVTLTVQAGVEVKFNSGTALNVFGALSATTAVFTSNDAVPVNGSWANVTFGNGTAINSSTLTGCTFSFGTYLYVSNNYTLNLTGSTVTRFSGSPLSLVTGATANVNNATLSTSNLNVAINGGTANFSNNSLVNNMGAANSGIVLTGGTLTLDNTNVTNSKYPLTINGQSVLNIAGTTSLLGNTWSKIIVNFSSLSTGTFNLPTANVPYVFPSGFTVASGTTLTIADNNILKFPYTGLKINGILSANASPGQFIYFTSYKDDNWGGDSNEDAAASAPAQSNWEGVQFNNNSVDASCVLRRAKIRYAIKGVETENAGPTIDLCEFSINYYGLSMLTASSPVVTSNSFGSSTLTPIVMSFEANPTFTNNSFSFSDNQYDAIGLYGGTLTASGTLKVRSVTSIPNVTYVLLANTTVPAGITLTIEPGIVIKTLPGSQTDFQIAGTILANGTLANPIVFTSVRDDNYGNPFDTNKDGSITSPALNDFGSFSMIPGSTGSSFIHCRIRYAGGQNTYNLGSLTGASLNFVNAPGTVQNCEIKDVRDGINCFFGATPTIQDNQFINLGFAVTLSAAANPTLVGNTLTNVSFRALGLVGVGFGSAELAVSGTIRQKSFAGFTNITYVLRNNAVIATGAYINVEAGVVIKNQSYGFTVNGGFKTDGTPASPVIFSSIKDDNVGNPGDTNGDGNGSSPAVGEGPGVFFTSSSDDAYCKLLYLRSFYGGSNYSKPSGNLTSGAIGIENANPVIDQVLLSNLSTNVVGMGVFGTSAPIISNTIFQNGSFFPVSMSILSNPSFNNITFTSMGYSAILINDDNIASNATLNPRSLAGIPNIAYVIDRNLTVNSGATLTISAGVVMKFLFISNFYQIIVNGALVVNGTSTNKVIFTAMADDSAGGDSNNDGNATTPAIRWVGIRFNDQSNDALNKIEFAEIRFAGISTGMSLEFYNAGGNVNNVAVIFGNTGLGIFGTANPVFQNLALQNLASPVRMDMFSNPTFGTISANNIAVMGIHIPTSTYSQTGAFPLRDFAGFTNITYILEGTQNINGGTTITIPAGMVFKSANNNISGSPNRFNVSGRLNVGGTAANPVVVTSLHDDEYGNPSDIEANGNAVIPTIISGNFGPSSALFFGDIADDNSTISYGLFRYTTLGINCFSSSPAITNSTFSKTTNGIYLSGTAAPAVNFNSFVDLVNTPLLTSILSYPSSSNDNTISGTTWKGIRILDETLSQDVTLPKRNFGGFTNIPYLFNGFTVGTTATLTILPGVVTKWQGGTLNINKGLNAQGGLRADSNIVFTSFKDDFYGGDMNSDGTTSAPSLSDWSGIAFNDVSLDPLCKLSNCFIRYASTGITTTNASPDIQKTSFSNLASNAINANGSSNPTINFCDFYNTSTSFGVNNVNQSFVINAENNWWGKNNGPTHTGNPTGTGARSSNAVDYLPFRNNGPNVPLAGDVSQNGLVQAFDASQILQFLVGSLSLTSTQQTVGDVSGNNSLTAMDASYILQFAVGLINGFQSEAYNRVTTATNARLSVAHESGSKGGTVTVPIKLSNVQNLYGSFARIKFDTTYLQLETLAFENTGMNAAFNSPVNGTLLISMAGSTALNNDVLLANLHLKIKTNAPAGLHIPLTVEQYEGNESDLTATAKSGSVKVLGKPMLVNNGKPNSIVLSPNPAVNRLVISMENYKLPNPFVMYVTDMAGKQLIQKSIPLLNNNGEALSLNLNTTTLAAGMYLLTIPCESGIISQKFIISR